MESKLLEIAQNFRLNGVVDEVSPITVGHINDTYVISVQPEQLPIKKFILQRINQNVFKDPMGLMENIQRITHHLREKIIRGGGEPERETLNLVNTNEGFSFFQDQAMHIWRVYQYIDNAHTCETTETMDQVYKTAWAFGNFQCQLADFPADQLHETIVNFHNTPVRYQSFCEAIQKDPVNRSHLVKQEIDFLLARESDTRVITQLLELGQLPTRVTHNDAKLNNVMLDDQTDQGICIIDLDTVMPGSVLYDFGDMVRSTAAIVAEDEPDWHKAGVSLPIFDTLVRGYLDAARDFITPTEIEHLAFSGRLITLEQAIRFLADYINGDIYYKISRPDHNLDRARTQIAMLAGMETHFDEMSAIVAKYRRN